MEIRKTLPRYLSILFIVALGVAFFSGVRASEPDMRLSADAYYDETNFMDIRVISTLGLTTEDLDAIRAIPGVTAAEPLSSVDAFIDTAEQSLVASVWSLTGDINRYRVSSGRLPETTSECLLDEAFLMYGDYQIGDTITLRSGTDDPLTDSLTGEEYTITGFGLSPMFLSWDRGAATIGGGEVNGFVALIPEAFTTDIYTQIYITADQADPLMCMTEDYDDAVAPVCDAIEEISDARCEIRYHELTDEPYRELAQAKEDVAAGWQEIEEARQKLSDALAELEEGESQIADARMQLADAEVEIDVNERSLKTAEQKLRTGRKEYEQGLAEYDENAQKIADAQSQLTEARITLRINEKELEEGKAQLKTLQDQVAGNEPGYRTALARVDGVGNPQTDTVYGRALLKGYADRMLTDSPGQTLPDINLPDIQLPDGLPGIANSNLEHEQEETLPSDDPSGDPDGDIPPDSTLPDTPTDTPAPVLTSSWQFYIQELYEQNQISETTWRTLLALPADSVAELMIAYATVTAYEEAVAAIAPLEQQIADGERQLNEGKNQLNDAQKELDEGRSQLEQGARELVKASVQLELADEQIMDGRKQLDEARKQLADGKAQLEEKSAELKDGWNEYYRESARAEIEIADAEEELRQAEEDIAKAERELRLLEDPQWYVLTRANGVQSYAEYNQDADRIGSVGEVFPVIFFLVAALVSLTTMTRMVEEQRTLIGTMKALGYGKGAIASKYILYALSASLTGSILGVLVGETLLPQVILSAYRMLYLNLPVRLTPLNVQYGLMSTGIAVLCTTAATIFACFKELISGPALLMRPAAPKQGKRVFLEKVPFLWSRLSFTSKSTVRNLFRYKKRFFMTVFGIGGCMALLMVGFGLRDSIHAIIQNQYTNIWVYDAYASVDDSASQEERDALKAEIEAIEGIQEALEIRQILIDTETGGVTKSATLFVPQSTSHLDEFIILKDRETGERFELRDDGVIINEKLASMLGLSAGDTITLKDGDTRRYTAVISAVSENYLNNFLYMTPALYEELYGMQPVYNNLFLNLEEGSALTEEELGTLLLKMDHVTGVTLISSLREQVQDMMHSLDLVVWVLIASAGLLAYVVLYNLNNINITERRRELATLKVLGFYDMEVAQYVYRENVLLTVFGCLFGLIFGFFLHRFVILTLEVDMIMFGRAIHLLSYILSILITFFFAAFVNFIMYFTLKKIDMVESLKSVE
jgi:putative ABC transport system permease protein